MGHAFNPGVKDKDDRDKLIKGGSDNTIIGNIGDNLKTGNIIDTDSINTNISVGTTAVEAKVGASRLADRISLTVFNNGSQTIYWGYSSSVTTTNGTPIFKNQLFEFDISDNRGVWLIASSAGQDVRVTEAS